MVTLEIQILYNYISKPVNQIRRVKNKVIKGTQPKELNLLMNDKFYFIKDLLMLLAKKLRK